METKQYGEGLGVNPGGRRLRSSLPSSKLGSLCVFMDERVFKYFLNKPKQITCEGSDFLWKMPRCHFNSME